MGKGHAKLLPQQKKTTPHWAVWLAISARRPQRILRVVLIKPDPTLELLFYKAANTRPKDLEASLNVIHLPRNHR